MIGIPAFDGDDEVVWAGRWLAATTTREVSGDSSWAFATWASASRATALYFGVVDGRPSPEMRPTALGVGVTGGGRGEAAGAAVRRFFGVVGSS